MSGIALTVGDADTVHNTGNKIKKAKLIVNEEIK